MPRVREGTDSSEDERFVKQKRRSNALGWKAEAVGSMGRILLGIVLGILLVPVAVMVWFHHGHPPVAVADTPYTFAESYQRTGQYQDEHLRC